MSDQINEAYARSPATGTKISEERRIHDIAVIDWAIENGAIETPFSLADATDTGPSRQGTGSGPREAGPWAKYQAFIDKQAQALRDEIRDDLTIEEVRAYYEAHPERFERQDDMTLEVTEWESERAADPYTVEISAANVRELQEQDDSLLSAALSLDQDEQSTIERGGGRFAQVRCVTRTDAGITPFSEVVQAAAAQHASELFSSQLSSRMAALDTQQ
ncbi:peptidylprolyl isomerase [Leucobacter sp. HY1908]